MKRRIILKTFATGFSGFSAHRRLSTSFERSSDDVDGTVSWRFDTGDSVFSSPSIVDGTVYVGSSNGTVYAIEDGTERWSFETGETVASSPNVVDDTVYIGSDRLYALDVLDGRKRWSVSLAEFVDSSPTAIGDTVYVGATGNLYAINAEDGTRRWMFDAGDRNPGSPCVVDGTVFVPSDEGLYAIDAEAGEDEWFTPLKDPTGIPTVSRGRTLVGGPNPRNIVATDADAGTRLWRFRLPGMSWIRGGPTVADGTVFGGSRNHDLYALAVDTGAQQWAYEAEGRVCSSPTVAEGVVFFGSGIRSSGYSFHAVDAADGTTLWRKDLGTEVVSSPTVHEGTVYVGSMDGHLYALDTDLDASSEDTRVALGTLGHHDGWTGEPVTDERFLGDPEPASVPVKTGRPASDQETPGQDGAGFGAAATVGGLAGAAYLLNRRPSDDE